MKEFKKKDQNRIWYSPIALLLAFCFLVFFSISIFGLVKKERETALKKNLVLQEIEDLKEREAKLNRSIENLNTEKGAEEAIRDKYQVVKEGEKMLVIVDEEIPKITEKDKGEHGFLNWFKNLFK